MRHLLLTPSDEQGPVAEAPPVPLRVIARKFWPYLRPYKRWIPIGLVTIAVAALATSAEIWLFQLVVDDVLMPGDLGPLPLIAAAYTGLLILGGLTAFVDDYVGTYIAERFTLDLRADTLAHLQTLPPDFLERSHLGDLLARLTGDIRSIEGFIVGGLAEGLSAALRLIFFTTALFIIEWRLALIAIVVAPLLWLGSRIFMRWIKQVSRERRRRTGSYTSVAEQALGNSMLVTASNRQAHEVERLLRQGKAAMQAKLDSTKITGLAGPTVDMIELIGMMAIVALGALAISDGALTLGGLLVFITYLNRMFGPARDIGALAEALFDAAAGAERVIEILDVEPTVQDRPGAQRLDRSAGAISLENVSFSYPGRDVPVLKNVNLKFEPGEMVLISGPSGAGKSTLAKLLLRLYDPDQGRLRIDDHDLRDVTMASLRRNVSILLQEAPLMRGTVSENIAYARPDASAEEIAEAARLAAAEEFIEALPEGYDTDLGERGRLLSGGQRQRIAIARAFLADAPILILDEPTTGLDPGARAALVAPLERLGEGRTTLIISHDPYFEREADRVVRIDRGSVVAPEISYA